MHLLSIVSFSLVCSCIKNVGSFTEPGSCSLTNKCPCNGPPGLPGPTGQPGPQGKDGRDSTVTTSLIVDLIKKVADLEKKLEEVQSILAKAGKATGLAVLDLNGNIPDTAMPTKFDRIPGRIDQIENKLAQSGKPNGLAVLDKNGDLPVTSLPSGYDKISAYDLSWQSLHVAAAAACRGSTPTGGSGPWHNVVLMRNTASGKNCSYICATSPYHKFCDGEVSIWGIPGKGTINGQDLGRFYNYNCDGFRNGGSEANDRIESIISSNREYLSFCCCRK